VKGTKSLREKRDFKQLVEKARKSSQHEKNLTDSTTKEHAGKAKKIFAGKQDFYD